MQNQSNRLTFEEKCNNFSLLLKKFANQQGCEFFDDSGEGHGLETDDLYCEDASGWLIPFDLSETFISSNYNSDVWDKYYVFAEWFEREDGISIQFKKYPLF